MGEGEDVMVGCVVRIKLACEFSLLVSGSRGGATHPEEARQSGAPRSQSTLSLA